VTLPEKIYTERDIRRARKKGKAIGWIQGGGVVIAGGLVLNLLGWIPTILVMVVVAYGLYRLLSKKPSKGDDDGS
jgi:hypothetical protein